MPCLYRLTFEEDQEPEPPLDTAQAALAHSTLHREGQKLTDLGTFAFLDNHQAGIFLDHEAELTVVEFSHRSSNYKSRFVMQPGTWRVLPPNIHWTYRYFAVIPMISINNLFVKLTEKTRWNTELMEEEISDLNLFERIQDYQQLYFCGYFQDRNGNDYMMFSLPLTPSCHGHISLYRNEWDSDREYHVTLQYKDILQTRRAHQYFELTGTGPPVLKIACHTYYHLLGFNDQGYTSIIPFQRGKDCQQQAALQHQELDDPAYCLHYLSETFLEYLNLTYAFIQ